MGITWCDWAKKFMSNGAKKRRYLVNMDVADQNVS